MLEKLLKKKEKGREELSVTSCSTPDVMFYNFVYDPATGYTLYKPTTENQMTTTVDNTAQSRRYLLDDIYSSRCDHYREIDKACHINPVRPTSVAQFIDWMENKKYKISKDVDINEPEDYFSDILEAIDFRPSEPDHVKRKAAYKQVDDDYYALKLRINVLDPSEKMVDEARKFKTRTYH